MAKVEFHETPEPPEGYDYTGEIRRPRTGELYFYHFIEVRKSVGATCPPSPILRKKRWRAKHGERYFTLNGDGEKFINIDRRDRHDDKRWLIGNYFKTNKQADDAMIEILQFWENYQPID